MSNKHGGKTTNNVPNEGVNIKKDLPRAKTGNPRGLSKTEISEAISKLVDEIYDKYPYEECMNIAKDSGRDNDDPLFVLLCGRGVNGVSVQNLPTEYLSYKRGKYDAYCFLCDVEKLFSELNREFEEIADMFIYGNCERKENNGYERS